MTLRFGRTTVVLTAMFTLLLATSALWQMMRGVTLHGFAGGWFGVLASQQQLVFNAGAMLPFAAFLSALVTSARGVARHGERTFAATIARRAAVMAALVFVLMALVAPMVATVIMRAAIAGAVPDYTAQGWPFFWQYYTSRPEPLPSPTFDAEYWRVAGLMAWTPFALSATACCTTLLGHLLARPEYTLRSGAPWALSASLVALVYTAWKGAWRLSLQHDLNPEYSLLLVLLGPALLTAGALLRRGPDAPRVAA